MHGSYNLSMWEVPWKVDDISHPCIGGTLIHLRWEKECGGNSPSFYGEFCKILPTQNGICLTFWNCGILDLPHSYICQYYRYGSEKLYSTEHICGSSYFINLRGPLKGKWYLIPLAQGKHQISSGGWKNVEETLPAFGVSLAKPSFLKTGYS